MPALLFMLNRNLVRLSVLTMLGIAFGIFLLVCFYALPFADDFCYAWTASADLPLLKKFSEHYLYWNGRYSADLLFSIHSALISHLLWYQFSLLLVLLLNLLFTWLLVEHWVKHKAASLIAAMLINVFHLCYLPNIAEGAYWFTGVFSYQLSNTILLLQLGLLAQLLTGLPGARYILYSIASLLCLVLLIGFNEVAAFLIPVYYFTGLLLSWHKKEKRHVFLVHFSIAIIAACFVFFSPGNAIRANEFPGRYDVLHSTYYSVLQTIRFIGGWMLTVPFVLLSLLILFYAPCLEDSWLKRIDYRFIFLILLGAVFSGAFLPYYATGILGQHRTINYVFFHFILLWCWFLVSASSKVRLPKRILFFNNPLARFYLLSFAIVIMIFSGNSLAILSDLRESRFTAYKNDFMQRQERVAVDTGRLIPPLQSIPSSFRIVDAKGDTNWWVDKCMKHFYSDTKMKVK